MSLVAVIRGMIFVAPTSAEHLLRQQKSLFSEVQVRQTLLPVFAVLIIFRVETLVVGFCVPELHRITIFFAHFTRDKNLCLPLGDAALALQLVLKHSFSAKTAPH